MSEPVVARPLAVVPLTRRLHLDSLRAGAGAAAVRPARARLAVFPEQSLTGRELQATTVQLDAPGLEPTRGAWC